MVRPSDRRAARLVQKLMNERGATPPGWLSELAQARQAEQPAADMPVDDVATSTPDTTSKHPVDSRTAKSGGGAVRVARSSGRPQQSAVSGRYGGTSPRTAKRETTVSELVNAGWILVSSAIAWPKEIDETKSSAFTIHGHHDEELPHTWWTLKGFAHGSDDHDVLFLRGTDGLVGHRDPEDDTVILFAEIQVEPSSDLMTDRPD